MEGKDHRPEAGTLRARLHEIIFEADTPAGKLFDVALLLCILLSVMAVMLDSVQEIGVPWRRELRAVEWVFTALFTAEYVVRLFCVGRPLGYAFSFFGLVDLFALLPTYLSLVIDGSQSLLVIRILRLLRVFRIFKMARYLGEARVLMQALHASMRKIAVFLGSVLTLVVVLGALMHLVEHDCPGFESIPAAMYWAIVTLTTVGYGDVVPTTALGKALASTLMVTGYGIIAVPTGIVTVELANAVRRPGVVTTRACTECSKDGHDADAVHCKYCGVELRR